MTTGTATQHITVVNTGACPTGERRRAMTRVTHVGAVDMTGGFARRRRTVVTTGTGTDNLRVIHCIGSHRCPRSWSGSMTGIALGGRRNVTG